MTKKKSDLVSARGGFIGVVGGETITLSRGDLVESDHPIVKKHPELFETPFLRYPLTEQATAAPGEKRNR